MNTGKITALAAALALVLMTGAAGFEFRTDGYFSTGDGAVKLMWDIPTRRCVLLVEGAPMIFFTGPASPDGKITSWHSCIPEVAVDKKQKTVVIQADAPQSGKSSFCLSEDRGGVRIAYRAASPELGATNARMLLPVQYFAGTAAEWKTGKITLPEEFNRAAPAFFNDWQNSAFPLRLALGGGRTLIVDTPEPLKDSWFSDCREWKEENYHLAVNLRDGKGALRLRIEEDAAPARRTAGKNLLREGASFETGADGVAFSSRYSWNEKMVTPGTPPELDSTAAVHGKYSLKLVSQMPQEHNGVFTFVNAVFKRTLLERGKIYNFSAWLKADRPGLRAHLSCGENSWSGTDRAPFTLTADWQRYSITVDTRKDFEKSGWCSGWISVPQDGQNGTVWVDAVQLEEGPLSDFAPSAAVELGTEIPGRYKLFTPDEEAAARILLRNNRGEDFRGALQYRLVDYWGKEVRAGALPLHCPAEGNISLSLSLGKLPCGYYRLYSELPGYEKDEAIFGVYQPQPLTPLPEDWPLACHNDPAPIVRQLGFGMLRAFEVFDFRVIAPAADRFNFTAADRYVEMMEKNGLAAMPILGSFEWPYWSNNPSIPPYAQEKLEERIFDGRKSRMAWPTIPAWKRYVGAVVGRYKGRIKYYEVCNEPNLYMTAEEYAPYLKAAYEAAKEADPGCRIVGLCATSDYSGKPDSYGRQVFALGTTDYFDLASLHLYQRSPEQSLGVGTDKALAGWRELLQKEYGKNTSVWHTEKSHSAINHGYSAAKNPAPAEYCDEPQFLISSLSDKANWMVRETLLSAIGGGQGKFFWFGGFYDERFIAHRIFQPYGLDHTEYDDSPMPELIAANGLARALTGMHSPLRQMDWGENMRCVLFAGKEGTLAALWRTAGTSRLRLPGKFTPETLGILDFFGAPLNPAQGENLEITVGEAPLYLRFFGMTGEDCAALLSRASLADAASFAPAAHLAAAGGAPALHISFINPQLAPVDAEVSLVCPPGWTAKFSQTVLKNIKPGTMAQAIFPLTAVPEKDDGGTFAFTLAAAGEKISAAMRPLPFASREQLTAVIAPAPAATAIRAADKTLTIDGDLGEWAEKNWVYIATAAAIKEQDGAAAWRGVGDCAAALRLAWNEKYLYLGARIYDDRPLPPRTPETAYKSDCLEIFLSPDGKKICQGLFFPLEENSSRAKGWWLHRGGAANCEIAGKTLADGYTVEAAIPWEVIGFSPKAGAALPFSFSLDDGDVSPDKRKTVMVWQGDTDNFQHTGGWGKLHLE